MNPSVNVQEESIDIPANPHTTLNFIGPTVTATDAGGGIANVTIEGDYALANVIDVKGPTFAAQRGFSAVVFDGTFIILTLVTPIPDPTKAIVVATIHDTVAVATLAFTIAASCVIGTDIYVRVWDLVAAANVFRAIYVRVVVLP